MKKKANVFVIDSVARKIVTRIYSNNPKEEAEKQAKGYFQKGDGKLKHIHIPTKKYPNRWGIHTPTDFFVHYLV